VSEALRDNVCTSRLAPGLIQKLSLEAFERRIELPERTAGDNATRRKVKVGKEEDMADPEATSALGGARGAPNEADC